MDYQLLKRSFGGNEVILLVYQDREFWDGSEQSMDRLSQLSSSLSKVPGVRAVMDLSQINQLVVSAETGIAGLFSAPPKPNQAGKVLAGIRGTSPLATAMRSQFEGYTHSANESWLAIATILEPSDGKLASTTVISDLRNAASIGFQEADSYFLVGEPVLVEEGFDLIENDGVRLGWTSAISLSLFLILILRTVRWTVATLAVVYWSLSLTRAVCVLAGWQLTMVSSMLVAMVTVISIATCMHWFVAYQRLRANQVEPKDALETSLRELFAPIVWACLTNAIAFAALMAAHVEPVRDYGLMMAVASLTVFVGILCIVPGVVLLNASVSVRPISDNFVSIEHRLAKLLVRFLEQVLARPVWTWMFLFVWVIFTALGTVRVEVETDFLKNFRSDSKLVKGYQVVEDHLGGAGVWDVILPAPDLITREYLAEVSKLANSLAGLSEMGLTKVITIAGAEAAARKSPILARLSLKLRLGAMRQSIPAFYDSLLTPASSIATDDFSSDRRQPRRLRIMLRAKENVSTRAKQSLIREVSRMVDAHTQQPSWLATLGSSTGAIEPLEGLAKGSRIDTSSQVTGYYVLLASLVQSIVSDQWVCFATATVAIAFALRLAIGSWSLALIALVPNTLPSLGILAVMGLIGMKMNLGAALIAAVSLGLSVDSSLHYLCQYVRRRKETGSVREALLDCQSRVGVPLLLSTTTLVIGFVSLATSEFVPTIVFGTTAAISMLFGLIGNLWWLPMLVAWSDRPKFQYHHASRAMNLDD